MEKRFWGETNLKHFLENLDPYQTNDKYVLPLWSWIHDYLPLQDSIYLSVSSISENLFIKLQLSPFVVILS